MQLDVTMPLGFCCSIRVPTSRFVESASQVVRLEYPQKNATKTPLLEVAESMRQQRPAGAGTDCIFDEIDGLQLGREWWMTRILRKPGCCESADAPRAFCDPDT